MQQAHAERLVLRVAKNNTGYWCVHKQGSYYLARMKRARLGSYATAEAAALAVARLALGHSFFFVFLCVLVYQYVIGNPLLC